MQTTVPRFILSPTPSLFLSAYTHLLLCKSISIYVVIRRKKNQKIAFDGDIN